MLEIYFNNGGKCDGDRKLNFNLLIKGTVNAASLCMILIHRFHREIQDYSSKVYEPVHEKTNNLGSRPGPTQPGLYSHRWLEAGNFENFGFRKKRNSTIRVAKTKTLISFAVTAKLICAFVFAYADCWFSHAVAHMPFTVQLDVVVQI